MFLKKIIFFEQYRGYNLLYSEAGAVGAGHEYRGMVVDIWNCSL